MQWLFDIVIAQMEAHGFITWPQAKAHVEAEDLDFIPLPHNGWIGRSAALNNIKFGLIDRRWAHLLQADFAIDTLFRLGIGTPAPEHPLHIVAAEAPDYMSLLIETVGDLHCYFGLKSPAANRNAGFYLWEIDTQRFLFDYVSGEDLLRFHNYTYGARELELLDNGDVRLPSSYGNTVGGTNHALYIDDTGKVGQQPSSEAVKTNVRDLDKSEKVHELRPVRFDDAQGGHKDQPGLLAEEVAEVMPELVDYKRVPVYGDVADPVSGDTIQGITHYETTEEPEAVRYEDIIPHLLKEIQTLRTQVDWLIENQGGMPE